MERIGWLGLPAICQPQPPTFGHLAFNMLVQGEHRIMILSTDKWKWHDWDRVAWQEAWFLWLRIRFHSTFKQTTCTRGLRITNFIRLSFEGCLYAVYYHIFDLCFGPFLKCSNRCLEIRSWLMPRVFEVLYKHQKDFCEWGNRWALWTHRLSGNWK